MSACRRVFYLYSFFDKLEILCVVEELQLQNCTVNDKHPHTTTNSLTDVHLSIQRATHICTQTITFIANGVQSTSDFRFNTLR